MNSKSKYLILNIGYPIILLILIAMPGNKGVAQFKPNLDLPAIQRVRAVTKDVQRPEMLSGLPIGSIYTNRRGAPGGHRNRGGKVLISNDVDSLKVIDYRKYKLIYLSSITNSWAGNHVQSTILRAKSFTLSSKLHYNKWIDELGFNLQVQLQISL